MIYQHLLLNSLQNGGTSWVSFNSFSHLNPLQDFNTSCISWPCTYRHPACMTGGEIQAYEDIRLLGADIWMISFLSSHHSIYRLWRLLEMLQHAYVDSPSSWLGFLGVIKIGLISVSFSLSLHCGRLLLGAGVSLGLDVEGPAWSSRSLSRILATDRLAATTQRAPALLLSSFPLYLHCHFLSWVGLGPNSVFSKLLRVNVTNCWIINTPSCVCMIMVTWISTCNLIGQNHTCSYLGPYKRQNKYSQRTEWSRVWRFTKAGIYGGKH